MKKVLKIIGIIAAIAAAAAAVYVVIEKIKADFYNYFKSNSKAITLFKVVSFLLKRPFLCIYVV